VQQTINIIEWTRPIG